MAIDEGEHCRMVVMGVGRAAAVARRQLPAGAIFGDEVGEVAGEAHRLEVANLPLAARIRVEQRAGRPRRRRARAGE